MVTVNRPVNRLGSEIIFFRADLEPKTFFELISDENLHLNFKTFEWAHQDSNLGPRDYESPALTAEL